MQAKEILHKEGLNFVLVSEKGILKSDAGGIRPIYDNYINNKEYFKNASVADRVIGRAAAILLTDAGVKKVYSDLVSQGAVDIFKENNIGIEYESLVEEILNRDKTDLCPMEKLSQDLPDAQELIERIGSFFEQNK